jgi:post-segregation antitoxin (ccd killing protein)
MNITLSIPDEIATQLRTYGQDLSRLAIEGLALEQLRAGHITEIQLGEMLGLGRLAREGFLKDRGVFHAYAWEEFEQEANAARSLNVRPASPQTPRS